MKRVAWFIVWVDFSVGLSWFCLDQRNYIYENKIGDTWIDTRKKNNFYEKVFVHLVGLVMLVFFWFGLAGMAGDLKENKIMKDNLCYSQLVSY